MLELGLLLATEERGLAVEGGSAVRQGVHTRYHALRLIPSITEDSRLSLAFQRARPVSVVGVIAREGCWFLQRGLVRTACVHHCGVYIVHRDALVRLAIAVVDVGPQRWFPQRLPAELVYTHLRIEQDVGVSRHYLVFSLHFGDVLIVELIPSLGLPVLGACEVVAAAQEALVVHHSEQVIHRLVLPQATHVRGQVKVRQGEVHPVSDLATLPLGEFEALDVHDEY